MSDLTDYKQRTVNLCQQVLAKWRWFNDTPYFWNPPYGDREAAEHWRAITTQARAEVYGRRMALAMMLGWPEEEGHHEGLIDAFLEFCTEDVEAGRDIDLEQAKRRAEGRNSDSEASTPLPPAAWP